MHNDSAIIPLQGFPLSPSHWRRYAALAPDDRAGSGMQADKADRILIVEDDLLVASEIEATLCDAGFEIAGIVATGREALQLAQAAASTAPAPRKITRRSTSCRIDASWCP